LHARDYQQRRATPISSNGLPFTLQQLQQGLSNMVCRQQEVVGKSGHHVFFALARFLSGKKNRCRVYRVSPSPLFPFLTWLLLLLLLLFAALVVGRALFCYQKPYEYKHAMPAASLNRIAALLLIM
jgi:hypothetical protein